MSILISIIFVLTSLTLYCQDKKNLSPELSKCDGAVIKISYYMERFNRVETNYLHFDNGAYKIKSILNSNNGYHIDTSFVLNSRQIIKLNNFATNIKNENIPIGPNGLGLAGTLGKFSLCINGKTDSLSNKSDYSFILDLLEK